MAFEYIKDTYKVPAEMYREVIVGGKRGVITEDKGNYIGVTFYDAKRATSMPCHPTSEVEYLETFNRKPPRLTASQRRHEEYLHEDGPLTFGEWLRVQKLRKSRYSI